MARRVAEEALSTLGWLAATRAWLHASSDCDETGAMGNPFRTPGERFPSFDKCIGKSIQASVMCCEDLCDWRSDRNDPNVCPGDPSTPGPWEKECYDACLDATLNIH